jgi:ssDNA-binding Zn-finger/Zn-ribbon topoisomerase 1
MILYKNIIGFNRYNYEDNTTYARCPVHGRVIQIKTKKILRCPVCGIRTDLFESEENTNLALTS